MPVGVTGVLANNRVNPTVGPVTRLACARRAPVPPAGYAERWAEISKESLGGRLAA